MCLSLALRRLLDPPGLPGSSLASLASLSLSSLLLFGPVARGLKGPLASLAWSSSTTLRAVGNSYKLLVVVQDLARVSR